VPVITTPPANQTVTAGASATFTAAVSGPPPLSYQWQLSSNAGASFSDVPNTAPYSGATTATLTVTGATAG